MKTAWLVVFAALLSGPALAQRSTLPTVTFCIAPSGNDAYTGVSPNCWASGTHAWNFIRDNYDLQGRLVSVQVSSPALAGILAEGQLVGARGAQSFEFVCTLPAQGCVLDGPAGLNARWGAELTITNFWIQGGVGISVDEGKVHYKSIAFGQTTAGAHINASGGRSVVTKLDNGSWIAGGGTFHAVAENLAQINEADYYMTIGYQGITFTIAYAQADEGAIVNLQNTVWAGYTCIGTRYVVLTNAVIETAGKPKTWIPCTGGWAESSGGVYN